MKDQEKDPKSQSSLPSKDEQASEMVVQDAKEVIEMAKEQVRAAGAPLRGASSVADQFRGLPISELIAAPLLATAEAQQKLSATAWDFYQKVAFNDGSDGNTSTTARTLDMEIERPVMQDGQMKMVKQNIKAPFVGLVPIPSLLVDHVDVDFQMEVTDTNVESSKTSADVDATASARWFVFHANLNGKVSTSRENTRTTNQTAKYQVHVSASQQPPTEGLSKLMDIMASCIEPIDSDSKE